MCTVSFVPTKSGFIFSNNRDEHIARAATQLVDQKINHLNLFYPQDPVSKGSWIAFADDGRLVCLLNGAVQKHKRTPPYRLSRGQLLLQVFDFKNFSDFVHLIDLYNIEPFTLIFLKKNACTELRWDGITKHIKILDPSEVHIWSSCTLYDAQMSKRKERQFLLDIQKDTSPEEIFDVHRRMKYEDLMEPKAHELIFTTSITQLIRQDNDLQFALHSTIYKDPLRKKIRLKSK